MTAAPTPTVLPLVMNRTQRAEVANFAERTSILYQSLEEETACTDLVHELVSTWQTAKQHVFDATCRIHVNTELSLLEDSGVYHIVFSETPSHKNIHIREFIPFHGLHFRKDGTAFRMSFVAVRFRTFHNMTASHLLHLDNDAKSRLSRLMGFDRDDRGWLWHTVEEARKEWSEAFATDENVYKNTHIDNYRTGIVFKWTNIGIMQNGGGADILGSRRIAYAPMWWAERGSSNGSLALFDDKTF